MAAQNSSDNTARIFVLEAHSNKPIQDANVSVLNSTLVANTNKIGAIEFVTSKVIGKDIFITHVSFESAVHYLEIGSSLNDTIFLSQKSVKIDDVVVKSKRSKNKKKWLRTFRNDVFGPYWKSRNMKIKNEEDILFSENLDSLSAHGNDIIEFENKNLGYKIRFILENYLHVDEYLRYTGKAWFEDLKVGNKMGELVIPKKISVANKSQ